MKLKTLLATVLAALLLAGCSTMARRDNVTGKWRWACCGGNYWGTMELSQDAGGRITGRFSDENVGSGGIISEGIIRHNLVQFKRTWSGHSQQYILELSPDGRALIGNISGETDQSSGTRFEAKRVYGH